MIPQNSTTRGTPSGGNIAVSVNSVTSRNGKLLMQKNKDGSYSLPGGIVREGETLEEACRKRTNMPLKIIRPLNPKISWKKFGESKLPIISINYLTELE